MPASSQTANPIWAYVDDAPRTPIFIAIDGMDFDGPTLIADLRRNPRFCFSCCTIDFNSGLWDFTSVTDAPVSPWSLRYTFKGRPYDDVLKLYLLCCLVWRRGKTHTTISHCKTVDAALLAMGAPERGIRFLTCEDFLGRQEELHGLSYSKKATEARQLCRFLEFYDAYFAPLADPDLIPLADRTARESARLLNMQEGWAPVPDGYLIPLLDTCRASLDDDAEPLQLRMSAASILFLSQVGLRTSEFLTLGAGTLEVTPGPEGCSDLVYLRYRNYKGGKGDGSYREGYTILNQTALRAYGWLVDHCEPYRDKLGVDTLLVLPRQRKRWCESGHFNALVRSYPFFHVDTVPCIGTQDAFSGLNATNVGHFKRRLLYACGDWHVPEVDDGETYVYPVVHQLRVTVATKLYESGVDMRYIRKHMSHMSEETTAGYIRSDRQIERAASETVYEALLCDGARLIGPRASEFTCKVEDYIATLDDKVKSDMEAVVQAAAARYPLRRKVGGVCIRCGDIVPCKASGATDEIYCAFGVCPNQCHTYYMAPISYETVRTHMGLVDANQASGYSKAAANELRKAQNVARGELLPELQELARQLDAHGTEHVLAKHPELTDIVGRLDDILEEVEGWLARRI